MAKMPKKRKFSNFILKKNHKQQFKLQKYYFLKLFTRILYDLCVKTIIFVFYLKTNFSFSMSQYRPFFFLLFEMKFTLTTGNDDNDIYFV